MPNGKAKGNSYERKIAVQFSEWWTKGANSDVFWRSINSGGRATTRNKTDQKTTKHCGDLAAIDSVGESFLRIVTMEIKIGYQEFTLSDLIDKPTTGKKTGYTAWIEKATQEHQQANSFSWLLIHKRDRRNAIVVMPERLYNSMEEYGIILPTYAHLTYAGGLSVSTLDDWFKYVDPDKFKELDNK